ncbi:MAG: hypothetical protein ABSG31_12700 [Tepidisphaeraceae bacterium]|jgi:hypothetical protein
MIDLLQIPGTWRRPNPPSGAPGHHPFDDSPTEVILYKGGEAEVQFTANGLSSTSGHWKIVQGFHLSIVVNYPDPRAIARGEGWCNFYYHLVAIEDNRMILHATSPEGAPNQEWVRLAPGRKFGDPA